MPIEELTRELNDPRSVAFKCPMTTINDVDLGVWQIALVRGSRCWCAVLVLASPDDQLADGVRENTIGIADTERRCSGNQDVNQAMPRPRQGGGRVPEPER